MTKKKKKKKKKVFQKNSSALEQKCISLSNSEFYQPNSSVAVHHIRSQEEVHT